MSGPTSPKGRPLVEVDGDPDMVSATIVQLQSTFDGYTAVHETCSMISQSDNQVGASAESLRQRSEGVRELLEPGLLRIGGLIELLANYGRALSEAQTALHPLIPQIEDALAKVTLIEGAVRDLQPLPWNPAPDPDEADAANTALAVAEDELMDLWVQWDHGVDELQDAYDSARAAAKDIEEGDGAIPRSPIAPVSRVPYPGILIEFTSPGDKPVDPSTHDALLYDDEFLRQLALQEEGLRYLTVEEYLANRDAYDDRGRDPLAAAAQRAERQEGLNDKIDQLLSQDYSLEEARAAAKQWLRQQDALHSPDQIAGGHYDDLTGVGDRGINRSLGVQWKHRADTLDEQIRALAKQMTPEERRTTRLHVRLREDDDG